MAGRVRYNKDKSVKTSKIKGQFSFFDRIIINGYLRPLLSEETRIGCLSSAKDKKEAIAKDILLTAPVTEGLICVLKTLESCRTAKAVGGGRDKHFLKSSSTKCLHYYLCYLDQEFGFMFVKIQTWFPEYFCKIFMVRKWS